MATAASETEIHRSTRVKYKSEKAQQAELLEGIKKLNSYIKKFNRLLDNPETSGNPERISELQDVVLNAQAEIHFLSKLSIAVDNSEVCELAKQVDIMHKHLNTVQTDDDTRSQASGGPLKSVSYYSVNTQHQQQSKSASVASRGSIRAIKNRLDAANVDIEIERLRKQAELKKQIDQMQLEL